MKLYGILAVAVALAACTATQTGQVVLTGCRGWNQYEIDMAARIPTMPADDYRTFSEVFARLTGGKPELPTNTGLCRGAPPMAADLIQRGVDEAMAKLQPLVLKYISK